jgi:hypothetical protein
MIIYTIIDNNDRKLLNIVDYNGRDIIEPMIFDNNDRKLLDLEHRELFPRVSGDPKYGW